VITLPKHFGRRLIYNNKAVYASPENIEEYATIQKVRFHTVPGQIIRLVCIFYVLNLEKMLKILYLANHFANVIH